MHNGALWSLFFSVGVIAAVLDVKLVNPIRLEKVSRKQVWRGINLSGPVAGV